MATRIRLVLVGLSLATLTLVSPAGAADETADSEQAAAPYELRGDLGDMHAKGSIRFLVHGEMDALPRSGDPRGAEQALARDFARKIGLTPLFVPVADQDDLIGELNAGHGDLIVASFAITPSRSEQIAFSQPIRFVDELVVVRASEVGIQSLDDLAGQEVTVRPASSYAEALKGVAKVVIKPAPETADTLELLQQVSRGETRITVADSDILAAARPFAPNLKSACALAERQPIAWGMRKTSDELKAALDAFLVEHALTEFKDEAYAADLDEIKKRGVLRVLTRNSSSTFFIYRGEQLGFDYELADGFAKSLGVRLEIIVPPSREALLEYLEQGRGDLVAAGMTRTAERQEKFAFSAPYQFVNELLIVPAKDKTTKALADLKGKKIAVRKSSSYYQTLAAFQGQLGFQIELLPEDLETEDVLARVGDGKLAATVADSNIVQIELTYDDRIRSVGPIGDLKEIAWVMRKDQPNLNAAADAYLKALYKSTVYNMTVAKYFTDAKRQNFASGAVRADKAGHLSPYDAFTKKHARAHELDWRLVTSQMNQESRFDPHAKSWVGAKGLMQVMPRTAQELKIRNVVDPDNGILAGVLLLTRYASWFNSPDVKTKDRIRFALASYNCGPGHVQDARQVAKDMGLNPNKWFGNVERSMLLLKKPEIAKKARYGFCRCDEPVSYVSQIQSRYDAYAKLVPLQ
jgi:membrane-bound lytic murein transglycosylase F